MFLKVMKHSLELKELREIVHVNKHIISPLEKINQLLQLFKILYLGINKLTRDLLELKYITSSTD